jgi:Uma2 family endonuclease
MMGALCEDIRYTYEDYAGLETEERRELLNSVIYLMSPAPMRRHQGILFELARQLANFLKDKPCKAYTAPFDVRLRANTVLQPDLVVVCDKSKLDDRGCSGAPDMVIEILSPSTAERDRLLKFNQYLESGVREYWIVDPEANTVSAYILEDGEYRARDYAEADAVPVHVLDGCVIDLADVFAE